MTKPLKKYSIGIYPYLQTCETIKLSFVKLFD